MVEITFTSYPCEHLTYDPKLCPNAALLGNNLACKFNAILFSKLHTLSL